jgi:hypothetical protein
MLQNNAHVHETIIGESDQRGNAQDVKKLEDRCSLNLTSTSFRLAQDRGSRRIRDCQGVVTVVYSTCLMGSLLSLPTSLLRVLSWNIGASPALEALPEGLLEAFGTPQHLLIKSNTALSVNSFGIAQTDQ